jgi:hypothetical protein
VRESARVFRVEVIRTPDTICHEPVWMPPDPVSANSEALRLLRVYCDDPNPITGVRVTVDQRTRCLSCDQYKSFKSLIVRGEDLSGICSFVLGLDW